MSRSRPLSLGTGVYAGVLVALAAGLVLVAAGPWRAGAGVCGGAMLMAGVARVLIPDRMSGLLRVRRRSSDALLLLLLGTALVLLAIVVPPQP